MNVIKSMYIKWIIEVIEMNSHGGDLCTLAAYILQHSQIPLLLGFEGHHKVMRRHKTLTLFICPSHDNVVKPWNQTNEWINSMAVSYVAQCFSGSALTLFGTIFADKAKKKKNGNVVLTVHCLILKWKFTQKWNFYQLLLKLKLYQTCMSFFLLLNIEDILKNAGNQNNSSFVFSKRKTFIQV